MRVKDALGQFGEQVAAQHLEQVGLSVVGRNWRCAEGEIDIIAQDGDVIVFCEVKTRSGLGYGDPTEALSQQKITRIRRLALRWLAANGLHYRALRFDVVSVLRSADGVRVRHLRGAF
jgi:putative endonuclease